MTTYRTMTVGGLYGKDYQAADAEAAATQAEADGYDVLDIMDEILVVAE